MSKIIRYNKKGDLELDELGKLILGLALLVVLIAIIWYIAGDYSVQTDNVKTVFNGLG